MSISQSLPQIIIILGGILVIITTVLTFFVSNSLKKLDNVSRMEEKIEMAISNLNEVTGEVKKIFGKTVGFDNQIHFLTQRITDIEARVKMLEREILENRK